MEDQKIILPKFNPLELKDSEYTPLPTEEDITKARKEGDKQIKNFSVDHIKSLRIRCKYDLPWFTHGILGYDLISPNLHGEVCNWMEETRYDQYTMLLLPRGHIKSTLSTISNSTQLALPDDLGNLKYPYNLGPNIRICICHDTAEMAQKFLRSITQHYTQNPLLIALFPECVPNPKKNKINIKELELPRSKFWGESTFDTMSVGARGQGNHYNWLELDDIYGADARDSKTERESHIQWFDNAQSFLITPSRDFIRIKGTRWSVDDVYQHAMDVYKDELKTFIRAVFVKNDNGKGFKRDEKGDRIPIYPEQFSLKGLRILEANKKVWNAQYLNDPREGDTKFSPEWKKRYKLVGRHLEITHNATPFSDGYVEEISIEELDICILSDPATEHAGGHVITGMDGKGRVFILECLKADLKPEQYRERLFGWVFKWNVRLVAIEDVLFSILFEHWFRAEMKLKGKKFNIVGVKTGNKEKPLRVLALSNWFEGGLIYFKEIADPDNPSESDKHHIELEREYDDFGVTEDYHMLDALAQGPREGNDGKIIWKKGGRHLMSSNSGRSKANAASLNGKDVNTGYSQIRGERKDGTR